MTYTAPFGELRSDDVALAGGKGANLGELSHAGLPVPPGFVVTTAAYKAFDEAGGLEGEIVGLASRPRADDPAAFEAAAEEIRALFAGGEIPDDVVAEIQVAYERLADGGAVAVRSSATAEDLPGASFAGQQETYLNVRGAAALVAADRSAGRASGRRGRWPTEPAGT